VTGGPDEAGVAVIIPCYNAAPTVAEPLASVIGQAGVAEIVAVDDGSRDETLAILRRHEPAVRVATGQNAGVSAARNKGISLSSAPWLLFLDSDDLLIPGTVAERLAVAADPERDVVICRWRELVDSGDGTLSQSEPGEVDWSDIAEDAEAAFAARVWAMNSAVLYPRPLVEQIGGFRTDLQVVEDTRFLFEAAAHGGRFRRLDSVGALYRFRPDSLSRSDAGRFWRNALRNGQQIEESWRSRAALSAPRANALGEIFDGAANALLRLGDPAAWQARADRRRYITGEPVKMRAGFALMRLAGGGAVRAAFGLGLRLGQWRRARSG
jgi:glycosyltransferase involved in cell wall biosynthesis